MDPFAPENIDLTRDTIIAHYYLVATGATKAISEDGKTLFVLLEGRTVAIQGKNFNSMTEAEIDAALRNMHRST